MKKYLFPIIYSVSIILVGGLISTVLYYFDITSTKVNNIFLYATAILSLFVGSLKLAKELNYKGFITGLLYFLFWFIIMLFLSLVIFKASFTLKSLIYYVVILLFSMLGGVLGKNMQEETEAS